MLTLERFAEEFDAEYTYEQGESSWISTSKIASQDGTIRDLSLNVLEPRLATFSLHDAYILWGYFPSKDNKVLFERMHHNAEHRERYLQMGSQKDNGYDLSRVYTDALHVEGNSFILSGPTDNLWHFMYNFALRLAVIKARFGSVSASPYNFIVSDCIKPDFLATLYIFGLPPERIVLASFKKPIKFARMTISELPFLFSTSGLQGSKSACRSVFGKKIKSGKKRIYISRADARWRKILNEDKIIEYLKDRNFLIIKLTNYSVDEITELMSSAHVVIGSSGANLAPTAFCAPGTLVIELSYHPMVKKYYFQMSSSANDLVHWKVQGTPEMTDSSYHLWNFEISLDALSLALECSDVM